MKKVWLSLLVVGIVATLVGAGTLAYFSDTETSTGNTIGAGVVNIVINDQDPLQSAVVEISDIKPGWDLVVNKTLTVEGNPADVYIQLSNFVADEGENPESETNNTADESLADVIYYDLYVFAYNESSGEYDIPVFSMGPTNTMTELEGYWILLGTLEPGTYKIVQSFHMDEDADNEYQGDTLTFTETFYAVQEDGPAPGNVWGVT